MSDPEGPPSNMTSATKGPPCNTTFCPTRLFLERRLLFLPLVVGEGVVVLVLLLLLRLGAQTLAFLKAGLQPLPWRRFDTRFRLWAHISVGSEPSACEQTRHLHLLFPSDESHRLHIQRPNWPPAAWHVYTHRYNICIYICIYIYIYIQAATILRPPVAWRLYYICICIQGASDHSGRLSLGKAGSRPRGPPLLETPQ